MDRYLGKKGMWFALGILALVFLCILACGAAAAIFAPRAGGVWVQAPSGVPSGEAGAAPPVVVYHGHGAWGPLGILGAGLGLLFKLAFFGLLLILLLRLARRLFWGGWHTCAPPWHGPWPGAPGSEGEAPEGGAGRGPAPWQRKAWRHHRHHHPWGPPPWWGTQPQPGPGPEGEAGEEAPEGPEGTYTGPME